VHARHKLVDVDRALALDRDSFEFLRVELDIIPLADLVALDDVSCVNFVTALSVYLAVLIRWPVFLLS
jgi:hypothetical protein